MGKHWHLFSPVAHLTLYSRKGLIEGAARSGLRVVASRRLKQYYDLSYVLSLIKYFFPLFAGAGRLGGSNTLKRIGFKVYTGIDFIVAEKAASS